MIQKGETLALMGMQWGDEGKGKLADAFCQNADFVVRYQGGHNAGHTVIVNDTKIVLHLLPCGVLHEQAQCVIANGVVLSLDALFDELDALPAVCDMRSRLFVSLDCPLLLPSHKALDYAMEEKAGHIGTTRRGIGPAYEDFYARRGLRLRDAFCNDFSAKLNELIQYHNFLIDRYYEAKPLCSKEIVEKTKQLAGRAEKFATDTVALLHKAKQEKKRILLEGAQGCRLDVSHGTYPFVTSSHTSIGGALTGSGLCHKDIDRVLGVTKAYVTRVGGGDFITEQNNSDGKRLHESGEEFGATTGRARRCGWLDLVDLKQAVRLNGVDELFVTKVDVLDAFEKIMVCVEYTDAMQPVYTELPGWLEPTSDKKRFQNLPSKLLDFIQIIERMANAPVRGLSVGASREQMILR